MQHVNGLGFAATGKQKLGRLVELEDEVAEEEDGEGHAAEYNHVVSPAHVAGHGAASFSRANGFTGRQQWVAAPFSGCSVSDARGNDDSDGLPHGKKSNEETAVLGKKFECNGCIDRDVTSESE